MGRLHRVANVTIQKDSKPKRPMAHRQRGWKNPLKKRRGRRKKRRKMDNFCKGKSELVAARRKSNWEERSKKADISYRCRLLRALRRRQCRWPRMAFQKKRIRTFFRYIWHMPRHMKHPRLMSASNIRRKSIVLVFESTETPKAQ